MRRINVLIKRMQPTPVHRHGQAIAVATEPDVSTSQRITDRHRLVYRMCRLGNAQVRGSRYIIKRDSINLPSRSSGTMMCAVRMD
ncbi:hypothetical protein [Sphingomonas sp. Leaf242]|uniref:hypothetical protein n=1 Tax=Sphingomonas sp. Leaf242 TaxID=1736304 RepID=UPI003FA6B739